MTRRAKILSLSTLLLLLAILFAFRLNPLERLLNVRLPRGVTVEKIYYERAPDYPVITSGYAKLNLQPEGQWKALVDKLQLSTNEANYLPWQNMPAQLSNWWDVPQSYGQAVRASRQDDYRRVVMLKDGTNVFIRFSGQLPLIRWDR